MKKSILILLATSTLLVACKKDLVNKYEESQATVTVEKMSDIKVPAGFKWELASNIELTVSTSDDRFTGMYHKVLVYSADPNNGGVKMAEGSVKVGSPFVTILQTPTTIKEYYLVKIAPDDSKIMEKVTIANGKATTNITYSLKKNLGKAAGPDCTSGCGTVVNNPSGNLTYSSGVTCLTGNINISKITLNNGAVVRICGTGVVRDLKLNGTASSQLIFTSTAVINFTSSIPVDGNIINYGTLTSNSNANININSNGTFTNHGYVHTGKNFNPNGASIIVNNGTIEVDEKLLHSSGADFTNNCKLIVHNDFDNNGLFKNYGYIRCDEEVTIQGGTNNEFKQYNGAMISTNDIQVNGTITGFGTASLIKVSDKSKGNAQGLINGAQVYCDANGIEGPWNASISGGATQNCTLTIPLSACNPEGNNNAIQNDADGDGVADAQDCYPNDATKAFCNNVPTGTLAFEDQWPFTGDYDMNDVVVNYSYNVITDAANKVVRVEATYVLRATGGSFQNGFGVQFPVKYSNVSGVSGATLEENQSKATLIVFTNMHQHNSQWNTIPNGGTCAPTTFNVAFNITDGPSLAEFGLSAYNPFIWNGTAGFGRGYEIHLPGKLPTNLADNALFGTGRDGSDLNTGDTYVTKNTRFPWAINIPANFNYPIEKADINTAYTKFATWVSSGGTQFNNWYTNTSGYRNAANIY